MKDILFYKNSIKQNYYKFCDSISINKKKKQWLMNWQKKSEYDYHHITVYKTHWNDMKSGQRIRGQKQ